tara:strand:- start:103 stop:510 length:408 start_codon:yes stop_codon:yes gene_type:complete
MKTNDLLKMVRDQAKKLNVQVVLRPYKTVKFQGEYSDGYFIEPDIEGPWKGTPGRLVVATKCPKTEWTWTLLHEYVHMMQWFRNDPIFLTEDYLELEKATEKETRKLAKQYNLPINLPARKRDSESYLKWLAGKR